MPKSFGSAQGLGIIIGLIIGVGVLCMAFAVFYKFVILAPENRWGEETPNQPSRENRSRESSGVPTNPYPGSSSVAPDPVRPYVDAEMNAGHYDEAMQHHVHRKSSHSAAHASHATVAVEATAVPVVDAVLYESDMETYPPNNRNGHTSSSIEINANDARAQAMRDWYDS